MARFFVALVCVAFCSLCGVLPIAARSTLPTAGLSDASRNDSALATPTPLPSQETQETVVQSDVSVYDYDWSDDDIHNETDEWDAALQSHLPDPFLANDGAAPGSPDIVSRVGGGGRRFRRRSASRVRRTSPLASFCGRGVPAESAPSDDVVYDQDEEVGGDLETDPILKLNETLHALHHTLLIDIKPTSYYRNYCGRRRRLSIAGRVFPGEQNVTTNNTENQEDILCQLSSRLMQVAHLTKLLNDSENIYAQTVQRHRTLLKQLLKLARHPDSGICVNFDRIQNTIVGRGITCPASSIQGNSPGGASSRISRDERFSYNCNRLREVETLLDACVELIRQAAEQQVQGTTSS